MKGVERIISIITAALMLLALPCTAYAEETEGFAAPETGETPAAVDLSGVDAGSAPADELLVLVEEGTSKKEASGIADDAGATLDNISTLGDGTRLAKVTLDDPEDMQQTADAMYSDDKVVAVQPNYRYRLEDTVDEDAETDIRLGPDSPNGRIEGTNMISQWHLDDPEAEDGDAGAVNAVGAWRELPDDASSGVKVAVIDTGVALDHVDLRDHVDKNKCVTFNRGVRRPFLYGDGRDDDSGHGTHVCGIIAAGANDSDNVGTSGVAYDRAELIVIDAALPESLDFTTQDVVLAIGYAVDQQASVINLSIGALYQDALLESAINDAFSKGVLCVCAAGNESSDSHETPGDAPGAVSVMAHDQEGSLASFSNYGADKDVSAPGVDILSTLRIYYDSSEGKVDVWSAKSGTSMAAPVVTGLAALLKSVDQSLNVREIKNFIYTSSGQDSYGDLGFGRIDAKTAVINTKADRAEAPSEIALNRDSMSMTEAETSSLEYAVYPGTASRYADEVEFTSSDPAVVSVDENGIVTARGAGTAAVTASVGGVSASCRIAVDAPFYAEEAEASEEQIAPTPPAKTANGLQVSGKTAKIRRSKLKKKARVIKSEKLFGIKSGIGRFSYSRLSGSSRLKIDPDTGNVTVKKKTKKGRYRMKVRVDASGDATHLAASRIVTVTVRVR